MTQEEIIDLLTDAINDSFDQDWTARDGACAIFNALYAEGLLPLMADDQARIDAAWEIHKAAGPEDHPNAEDYRNRAERAEAELAEVRDAIRIAARWFEQAAINHEIAAEVSGPNENAAYVEAARRDTYRGKFLRAALNGGKHD